MDFAERPNHWVTLRGSSLAQDYLRGEVGVHLHLTDQVEDHEWVAVFERERVLLEDDQGLDPGVSKSEALVNDSGRRCVQPFVLPIVIKAAKQV